MGLLRLFLAISIIMAHAGSIYKYQLIDAKTAVQSFYILSGFYMSLILNNKYAKVPYRLFISNRLLRIYPTYWLILLLTGIVSFVLFGLGHFSLNPLVGILQNYKNIHGIPLIYQSFSDLSGNIFIFTSPAYFTINPTSSSPLLIGQSWTLGIELLFYFIAPFLVRRKVLLVTSCILLSFLLRVLVFKYDETQTSGVVLYTMRFFPGIIMFFLSGTLSYKLYARLQKRKANIGLSRILFLLIIVFTLGYTFLAKLNHFILNPVEWIYYFLLIITIPYIFVYLKNSKLDNLLGNLSYPVYISHSLIILLLLNMPFAKIDKNIFPIITIIITLLFSYLIFIFFESPIDDYRQRRLKRIKKPVSKSS